ncbi:MFS multidrug transporter [Aspergillus aculeatinus CBS 121060]|uniref:MFS multidrug transporter n=1 Tax=Aspergillus aculeatinus CBS 121060 TaxID=1448322 RepID=A0ACD1HC91_9EURO|nr:MFS multidrug transporter [Aspergillus aculeatinus CBS 121060]RAH71270.1 MFS multidrug transporter [Aspergillus aculeatinus CBS 121060]
MGELKLADYTDLDRLAAEHELELTPDGAHLRWGKTNRKHPRNWHPARKTYDITVIGLLEFFTTAMSTSGAATAKAAQLELGTGKTFTLFLYVSTYLLGQGLGGVVFPPYSETFGRKRLYVLSALLYSVFCLLIGAVPSASALVIGRLVTGFLSAIPTIVITGSIEDLFNSQDRIWVMLYYVAMACLGVSAGPIMSSYVTYRYGWRWVFNIGAIVTCVLAAMLMCIKESRPSLILAREVQALRKLTGNDSLLALNPDFMPDLRTFAHVGLFRPLRLFFTEPIVFVVTMVFSVCVALIYLFAEALPPIFEAFGFSTEDSSLPFLALGLGFIPNIATRILDYRITQRRLKEGLKVKPEHKLTGIYIGAPVLALSLWWFAWTVPPVGAAVHWLVPVVALFFTGYGLNEMEVVVSQYMADSYLSYAASGFAALSIVRSLLSATFPLFGSAMFDRLGANIGMSILAVVATLFCIVPPLLSRYGERMRKKSNFAKYSLQVYAENGVDSDFR